MADGSGKAHPAGRRKSKRSFINERCENTEGTPDAGRRPAFFLLRHPARLALSIARGSTRVCRRRRTKAASRPNASLGKARLQIAAPQERQASEKSPSSAVSARPAAGEIVERSARGRLSLHPRTAAAPSWLPLVKLPVERHRPHLLSMILTSVLLVKHAKLCAVRAPDRRPNGHSLLHRGDDARPRRSESGPSPAGALIAFRDDVAQFFPPASCGALCIAKQKTGPLSSFAALRAFALPAGCGAIIPARKIAMRAAILKARLTTGSFTSAKIGAFSKTEHGYKGRVRTLTVNTEVEIVSIDPSGDSTAEYPALLRRKRSGRRLRKDLGCRERLHLAEVR